METKTVLIALLVVAALAGAILFLARAPEPQATATTGSAPPTAAEAAAPTGPTPSETPAAAPPAATPGDPAQAPTGPASPSSAPSAHRIVASYFHNTTRCVTCRAIEQLARETIESAFAAELASGRLVWRALNMELRENEHYAFDYDLTSPSLVLASVDGEEELRFKVLTDTWTLVHKKTQFVSYIETEVRAFLEGP